MNRRGFFEQLASGLLVAAAPTIFVPKLISPVWKPMRAALAFRPDVYICVVDVTKLPGDWAANIMKAAGQTVEIIQRAHPNLPVKKYTKLKQNWFVDWEPAQTYAPGDKVTVG